MSITNCMFDSVTQVPILSKSAATLPILPSVRGCDMSTHKIGVFTCISSAAVCLSLVLLSGCGVFIDQPADKSTVSNPVAASITLRSYCSNFSVTLDGNDVTNQFTSPNVSPATAVFSNLLPGQHTLSASAYTNVSCSGSSPNSKASSTFTVPPPHKK